MMFVQTPALSDLEAMTEQLFQHTFSEKQTWKLTKRGSKLDVDFVIFSATSLTRNSSRCLER